MGAHVTGIALEPNTNPALFDVLDLQARVHHHILDIRDTEAVAVCMRRADPEIVFHLAAQPLVRASYTVPIDTFATNVMGTVSVLDALRGSSVRVAVIITTDKVYRNIEHGLPYGEDDLLGGHDPYSASKAASEIVIASYRDSFLAAQNITVASARAGNVIGGGDWAAERLVPDAIRAWTSGIPLKIRRPAAVRPWQHVLEPLSGYMALAQHLWTHPDACTAINFGPELTDARSVRSVIEMAQRQFPGSRVEFSAPPSDLHEAGLLSLEIERARTVIGWKPRWSLDETVNRTINWYRLHHDGLPANTLCEADIKAYEQLQ
jgi:CDP-glucose 4,6-dehydratase